MRSSVDEGAGGFEFFIAERAVLAFPRSDDVSEASGRELATGSVGEPCGHVLLVSLGGLADGVGEL